MDILLEALFLTEHKTSAFLFRYHGISGNRFGGGTDGFAVDVRKDN